jgi:eukaryotic-like serine/threonine-protein kinase
LIGTGRKILFAGYNQIMAEDLIGRTISHYRIIKLLGSGGMGEIYLADDIQLDRTVAIKVLPATVASDQDRMSAFIREAKAASAIDHPNIVHVYEVNQSDDINFIAMQYVEGETLGSKINGKPLEVSEFLQIAIQIMDAIAEAHARGIVHRDLKPANIMISNKGYVKLLDFGLARIQKVPESSEFSKVQTWTKSKPGVIAGTISYMSPEQALGKNIDHRTDIFSMGVVFYEMITGQRPFSGSNPTETIDKIVHSQPESIIRFNYNAPQELERIIRKCLEKDPERRYQSAADVLIDLKNLKRDLDSSNVNQQIERATTETIGGSKRNYWIPAALLMIAAVIGGLFFYRSYYGTDKAIHSLAVLPFRNLNPDPQTEYLSDGISDSIINNLSPISQLRVMARSTVFTYKNKEVDPRQIHKDLGVDGVVTGELLQQGEDLVIRTNLIDARDGSTLWGEQYQSKLQDLLSIQSQISKEISNALRIKLSKNDENLLVKNYTSDSEAYQLYLKGQFFLMQRTPTAINTAMDFFQKAIDKDPTYALAYSGKADCYNYLGITGAILGGLPPKQVMPQAKELVLKAIQLDDSLPQAHRTLGHIHLNYDLDWNSAEKEFNKSLELNPNDPLTQTYKTFWFISLGRNDEAHASMQLFKKLDPGTTPGTIVSTAIQHYWMREYDLAIDELKILNEMSPNYPSPYYWLGLSLVEKKNYNDAIKAFEGAVTSSHRAPVALTGLGIGYARAGMLKEANSILDELLNAPKNTYIPEFYLASVYVALGKKDEAFEWLNKAYQERANGLSTAKVFPILDDLRSDPRFAELLSKLKLN